MEIERTIEIEASADRVWEVLAELEAYPVWNPFVVSMVGELTPGARLTVRLQPPGGRAMTLRPTVLRAEPGRELRWLGRLGVRGLLDGEHHFTIQPLGPARVRFVHGEAFRGLLVRLVGRTLGRTAQGFEAMNRALKALAESGA